MRTGGNPNQTVEGKANAPVQVSSVNSSDSRVPRPVREIFLLREGDGFLVYAPLRGVVCRINQAAAAFLRRLQVQDPGPEVGASPILGELRRLGLVTDEEDEPFAEPATEDDFSPTDVVLLVTGSCNLRCRYCYASAGERQVGPDVQAAQAGIRWAIRNALDQGRKECSLSFHGGGEPTLALGFIRGCVEEARTLAARWAGPDFRILPGLVTNGYVSDSTADWLARNMHSIQVSLDGPQEIHDSQRPRQDGAGSFTRVLRTVQRLEERGTLHLTVKATVSSHSVARMAEIADFLCRRLKTRRFHLGPVLDVGRSLESGFREPSLEEFLRGARRAREAAARYGKEVVVSLTPETFPQIRLSFCGVTEPNFAITPEGRLTGCYEVIYADDPRAQEFHYGHFERKKGGFQIDLDRVRALRRRHMLNLEQCRNCFARWQCAGDCQARRDPSLPVSTEPDFRCRLNRALLRERLLEAVSGGGATA